MKPSPQPRRKNSPIVAMRLTQSIRSSGSSCISSTDACFGSRCPSRRALVWACSPARNRATCCGSVFCNASKLSGSLSLGLFRRCTIFSAPFSPKAFTSSRTATSRPPAITVPLAAIICLYSSSTCRVSSAGTLGRFANSSATRSRSDGGKLRRTGTASASFRAAIKIAALRAPAKDD